MKKRGKKEGGKSPLYSSARLAPRFVHTEGWTHRPFDSVLCLRPGPGKQWPCRVQRESVMFCMVTLRVARHLVPPLLSLRGVIAMFTGAELSAPSGTQETAGSMSPSGKCSLGTCTATN